METEEDEPRISFIGSEATKLLKDYLRTKKTESEYVFSEGPKRDWAMKGYITERGAREQIYFALDVTSTSPWAC